MFGLGSQFIPLLPVVEAAVGTRKGAISKVVYTICTPASSSGTLGTAAAPQLQLEPLFVVIPLVANSNAAIREERRRPIFLSS